MKIAKEITIVLALGAALTGPATAQEPAQGGWNCTYGESAWKCLYPGCNCAYDEEKTWRCLHISPSPPSLSSPAVKTKYCNPFLYYCPDNTTQVPMDYPLVKRPRGPGFKCTGSIIDPAHCLR